MTRDQIAALLLILLAAFGGVYAMLAGEDNARSVEEREFRLRYVALRAEPSAPETVFVGPDGRAARLSDFRGRVVLLNLWASWCAPCVRELPALDRLQAQLSGRDFLVVAVNLDRDPEEGRRYLRARGIRHLKLYYDGKFALYQALNAQGLPLSVLIDRRGRMLGRLAGAAAWDGNAARKVISAAIAEGATGSSSPPP